MRDGQNSLFFFNYKKDVIGFEVDLIVFWRVLCTNLPLFTKVVFASFHRGSCRFRIKIDQVNNDKCHSQSSSFFDAN